MNIELDHKDLYIIHQALHQYSEWAKKFLEEEYANETEQLTEEFYNAAVSIYFKIEDVNIKVIKEK